MPHIIAAGVTSDNEAATCLNAALQDHKSAAGSILPPLCIFLSISPTRSLAGAICITSGLDGFVKNTCSTKKK